MGLLGEMDTIILGLIIAAWLVLGLGIALISNPDDPSVLDYVLLIPKSIIAPSGVILYLIFLCYMWVAVRLGWKPFR